MNIGIVARNTIPGTVNSTGIYTYALVRSLADFSSIHRYQILVGKDAIESWQCRPWPENIELTLLREVEQPINIIRRFGRVIGKEVGITPASHYGPAYISRQLDSYELDLIHFPETVIYPISIKTRSMLTFFDMQHEFYPEFFTEQNLVDRSKYFRKSVDQAWHLLVPSEFTRKTLVDKYQVPEEKMTLLPVGLDGRFKKIDQETTDSLRKKYGLTGEYIYYPANPWQHKNHSRLMAAMRIYRQRYGDPPTLVLTGRLPNETREAMSLAIAAGVEDHVVDLGAIPADEIPGIYNGARMMVFPSLFEGFGMPLIEAMACGCPITAADATTIPEITRGAALLFDPFVPEEIADCINRLLTDADLRHSLMEKGFGQLERFEWSKIVGQLEEIYTRVGSMV